jgi:hypothetical protein
MIEIILYLFLKTYLNPLIIDYFFYRSPGCIPCKVYAEDTPMLTIDSIVICQTHAEDRRRSVLKMHPGSKFCKHFKLLGVIILSLYMTFHEV